MLFCGSTLSGDAAVLVTHVLQSLLPVGVRWTQGILACKVPAAGQLRQYDCKIADHLCNHAPSVLSLIRALYMMTAVAWSMLYTLPLLLIAHKKPLSAVTQKASVRSVPSSWLESNGRERMPQLWHPPVQLTLQQGLAPHGVLALSLTTTFGMLQVPTQAPVLPIPSSCSEPATEGGCYSCSSLLFSFLCSCCASTAMGIRPGGQAAHCSRRQLECSGVLV